MAVSATVKYYFHSGFTVEVLKTLFIFDYWRGENQSLPEKNRIRPDDLDQYDRVLIFVSHDHPDHLDPVIWTWRSAKKEIHYVIAYDFEPDNINADARRAGRMHVMRPGDEIRIGDIIVHAFPSTDKGVSYFVRYSDLNIFHAGDLNFWHWRDESTIKQIKAAEKSFNDAIRQVESVNVDIAFFPLDPRMGAWYEAGANRFIFSVKPAVFFPMHWQGHPEVAKEFVRKSKTRYTEAIALTRPGEYARINLDNNRYAITVFEPKEESAVRFDSYAQENPFSNTDQPVEINLKSNTEENSL